MFSYSINSRGKFRTRTKVNPNTTGSKNLVEDAEVFNDVLGLF